MNATVMRKCVMGFDVGNQEHVFSICVMSWGFLLRVGSEALELQVGNEDYAFVLPKHVIV